MIRKSIRKKKKEKKTIVFIFCMYISRFAFKQNNKKSTIINAIEAITFLFFNGDMRL